MKTNIKTFLAAVLVAMTSSCTDLDVKPEAQFTEYPNSEAAIEAQMADVYFHLRGTLGRRYMEAQALSSDEWVGISFDGDYAVFTRSVCLDEWHRLVTIGVFVNRFFVVQAVFGYDRTWGNKFELDITYV